MASCVAAKPSSPAAASRAALAHSRLNVRMLCSASRTCLTGERMAAWASKQMPQTMAQHRDALARHGRGTIRQVHPTAEQQAQHTHMAGMPRTVTALYPTTASPMTTPKAPPLQLFPPA